MDNLKASLVFNSDNALKGKIAFKGERGYSAYEIAVQNGFKGDKEAWLKQIGYEDINAKLPANVKNFGAVGDGITDDTEAIQNAINSCDDICIPTGTYIFTSLTIDSNKKIYGDNFNTILKGKTITIKGTNNILKNIIYDGNLDSDGILVTANNNLITDCEFYNIKNNDSNVGAAINCVSCNHIEIRNSYFHDLISGNENAEVGIDDGAIRAIRAYGCDYINIHNNRFENLNGLKDGDYIHIASGELGTEDTNFPYNGTKRYNFNDIKIHDNSFLQQTCKSCIKVQCSNVNIFNNHFNLINDTKSHYAIVRVQSGDYNNVFGNTFNVVEGAENYNHIILYEYTANGIIKNNIFDIEKTSIVNTTSSQDIIQIQHSSDISVTENTVKIGDINYIFYVDSCKNININKNNIDIKITNQKVRLIRILNNYDIVSNNINLINNVVNEEVIGTGTITNGVLMEVDTCEALNIIRNQLNINRYYLINVFTATKKLNFNNNNIVNSYDETGNVYPVVFYSGCEDLCVKNNENNLANAFFRMMAVVKNFKFTANGNFETSECCYNATDQDFSEYHYFGGNGVSQNYDFGYAPRECNYENGHTYYHKSESSLKTYIDGSWL